MATISQVQAGLSRYIDNELLPAFEGWKRVLVGGGAALALKNLPNIAEAYGGHPLVAALGVYNAQNHTIDVDALAAAFLPRLGADSIPVVIPGGITVRLGKADFEKIIRYIQEA